MKPKVLNEWTWLEEQMKNSRSALFGFIYRMVLQRETAEEIFQEVWLKVVDNLDKWDRSQAFEPWLFRIARNQCIDHIRKRKRREIKDRLLTFSVQPHYDKKDSAFPPLDEERLPVALNQLPVKYREVLHLRFYLEMSVEEVSAVLNIPGGTVKSRVNRGLQHLKKQWKL